MSSAIRFAPHGLLVSLLLIAVLGASGCSVRYSGRSSSPMLQHTTITFKENDFELVRGHLTGSAQCSYVFGIPLGDSRVLSRAKEELANEASGQMDGRPAQLVNWTMDQTWVTYVPWVYRRHRLVLSADLVEFDARR